MASPVVSSSASAFISTAQKLDNWVVCNRNIFRSKFNKKHSCIHNIYTYRDKTLLKLPSSSTTTRCRINAVPTNTISSSSLFSSSSSHKRHWLVVMDSFHLQELDSRPEIINYYVKTIQTVLGSEEDAEMCLYDASCETHFGFCCEVDEDMARKIAGLPGVLSVRPDPDFHIVRKDSSYYKVQQYPPSSSSDGNSGLNPQNYSKHWLVRTETPLVGVMGKAQVVDYYVQILSKVLGNEKDAQMCMYNVFWQSNFGFCCELDDVCAQELAGVLGVISVQPDETMDSYYKDSGGENLLESTGSADSLPVADTNSIGTKKLFVTGLSFYTSEKTLRAAFEGFGELVEVRIIMDKISKRSKGYAFIEYTTESAASAALQEMNGKIINGWMIVVDVAKKNPPKYGTGRR